MVIEYVSLEKCRSFGRAVASVCRERLYLATTTGFSLQQTEQFVKRIIKNQESQFYAIEHDEVIGWCDILPREQELLAHTGVLGMGIVEGFRHKGIGTELLNRTISHARERGLERIELEVFASNTAAIRLYEKTGFVKEGVKKKGKKLDNKFEDIVIMGLV
ncbi:MAG: hypothetical protein A2487_00665 [Candidatus Raymondbacteria bacterium RifOxyC12_full_50_8]|uniref:N-acetyltransferase domain-containing protein n=1 Tax=Candidatus Raymondbacteria bacterium RIFOXYD12_FULL_49_13 TaxID=1817890 RepID=A0A1F7F9L5_UNCRA|nr:MAG: hypothetical protein A2350_03420 [Candidatus Raymondbacteria bacterium RifOxyB12_full_50_8]OGJ93240.1 MAG: hypothetical protein A2248_17885 [Candidatus Raymondbacteria bacterium RIFOXYA2_FULL_49_16]OGJ98146.1 MAG: hypothetical protein A2487_00665 [Candidatus Raymondbacteria bacterium RifOxyC12_full_50_8]OGK03323.1 MAG: hypothetical protein A2519_15230 [Candidatus Raymondbacteria bacterium RIFOXYD12_FULL_49_13]OGP44962.1 MAG: hypothetical protein A2324_19810 [Candidatus Raymondbacteria b